MSKGTFIFVIILVGGLLFSYQTAKGYWLKTQLAEKIDSLLPQLGKTNQTEIHDQIVSAARTLGLELSPEQVKITYEPTTETNFAQRVVSPLATFENYRASAVVNSPVTVWGITLSSAPIELSRVNQEKAVSKRQPELDDALKATDEAQSGTAQSKPAAPAPAPRPVARTSPRPPSR